MWIRFGVIITITAFTGDLVAHVTVTVALARPARLAPVFRASEITRNAFLALFAHGQVGASMADGLRFWTLVDQLDPRLFDGATPTSLQQFS